ncbi:MAG: hypothetical protein M0008_12465 [Actinomycetota bacterium]|nr:hypothetical protein [Actinomycetota bacterium]
MLRFAFVRLDRTAGGAFASLLGFGANEVLAALAHWVASGTVWLLGQVGMVLSTTTKPDLASGWFGGHYEVMAMIAATLALPLAVLSIIQAVLRQQIGTLLRSMLVNLPAAMLLTAVAVKLVQLSMALVDVMSSTVVKAAGVSTTHFLAGIATSLEGSALTSGHPGVPAFVIFLGALFVGIGAFVLWIELVVRTAAIYVAVLFLPITLASMVWPAIARWARRLVDILIALVLTKFVVVAVLSLAAGELAGAKNGGSFTGVIGGGALLLLAVFSPAVLFRIIPMVEDGAVVHLEGIANRASRAIPSAVKDAGEMAVRALTAGGDAVGGLGGAEAGPSVAEDADIAEGNPNTFPSDAGSFEAMDPIFGDRGGSAGVGSGGGGNPDGGWATEKVPDDPGRAVHPSTADLDFDPTQSGRSPAEDAMTPGSAPLPAAVANNEPVGSDDIA